MRLVKPNQKSTQSIKLPKPFFVNRNAEVFMAVCSTNTHSNICVTPLSKIQKKSDIIEDATILLFPGNACCHVKNQNQNLLFSFESRNVCHFPCGKIYYKIYTVCVFFLFCGFCCVVLCVMCLVEFLGTRTIFMGWLDEKFKIRFISNLFLIIQLLPHCISVFFCRKTALMVTY